MAALALSQSRTVGAGAAALSVSLALSIDFEIGGIWAQLAAGWLWGSGTVVVSDRFGLDVFTRFQFLLIWIYVFLPYAAGGHSNIVFSTVCRAVRQTNLN